MRHYLSLFLVILMASPALQGCASKYGPQRTNTQYYAMCYRPIQDLRERENTVTKSSATGALIGALGGALIGLLSSGGKWQGAAIGAATGGASGAIMGGIEGNRQKEMEDNQRMAVYMEQLDGDISNLDISAAAARTSLQCYDRQFDTLLAQIRSRSIDYQAARARFNEISSGREEAIAILGDAAESARNVNRQYDEAIARAEREEEQTAQVATPEAARQKQANISKARKRKTAIAQKSRDLGNEKKEAQNNSARQNQELNAEIDRIYENASSARI